MTLPHSGPRRSCQLHRAMAGPDSAAARRGSRRDRLRVGCIWGPVLERKTNADAKRVAVGSEMLEVDRNAITHSLHHQVAPMKSQPWRRLLFVSFGSQLSQCSTYRFLPNRSGDSVAPSSAVSKISSSRAPMNSNRCIGFRTSERFRAFVGVSDR